MRNKYVTPAMLEALKVAFSSAEYDAEAERPALYIAAEELLGLLRVLRDDGTLQLTRLENVTAVDWKDRFEMVYHLFSPTELHWLTLKVMLPHDAPVLPSATSVFPGAEFEEREVYDLMGIVFTGHPDLRRVFHADDLSGIRCARTLFRRRRPLSHPFGRRSSDAAYRDLYAQHGPAASVDARRAAGAARTRR